MREERGPWRSRVAVAATVTGLLASLLSAAESEVPWIASLCGLAGNGCRETAAYGLAGIPLALWGILFYLSLILARVRRSGLQPYMVMAGAGVEAVLIAAMVRDHFFCLLCGVNAVAMVLLAACFFPRIRLSAGLASCFGAYILTGILMTGPPAASGLPSHENPSLARVNGVDLLSDEVNQPIAGKLQQLNQRIYRLQKEALEGRVCRTILTEESRKKGMDVGALRAEILSDLPPVTDETVSYYFTSGLYKRLGKWTGTDGEIKGNIRADLTRRMAEKKIQDYCLALEEEYGVEIFLAEPPLPVTRVPVAGSPSLGPENAQVTVVEFSDYLCPSCRSGHDAVKAVRDRYRGKVKWVFRDFPLKMHPGAEDLARAARCAGKQGRFWDYQDALFSGAAPKNPLSLARNAAQDLGLDMPAFDRCMADPAENAALAKEIARSRRAGISMTPSFIINGRLVSGLPDADKFAGLIDPLLEESGS